MAERYTGTIVEIGGEEIGRTGKPKPRKVVISDRPGEYQGKTFRIWQDSEDFHTLAAYNGQQVTVEYDPQEVTGGNGKTWTQNMIVGVETNGNVPHHVAPDPGWERPAPEQEWGATDPPVASRAPATKSHGDDRSSHIEAAWAIKAILDRFPGSEIVPDELIKKSLALLAVKDRVAAHRRGE